MTGKREQKRLALREAIYLKAVELFETRGYDTVSVGEIVRAVGIAKGTFFNHFPTKADILAEWYRRLVDVSVQPRPDAVGALERLVSLAADMGRLAVAQPELWQAKSVETPRSESLRQIDREGDERLVMAMTRELATLALVPTAPPPEAIADTLLAITTGTWREAIIEGAAGTAEDRLRSRFAVVLSTMTLASGENPN